MRDMEAGDLKEEYRRAAVGNLHSEISQALARFSDALTLIYDLQGQPSKRNPGGWPKGRPRGRRKAEAEAANGEQPAQQEQAEG